MKHRKTIIIGVIVLAISFIMIALFNSTYALFSVDVYGTNTEVYTTGMLAIEASSKSENISLDTALPISDDEGKETTPYVFTIKNIGNLDYEFNIELLSVGDSDTTIQPSYIKLQIDDGNVTSLAAINGVIKSNVTLLAGESIDVSIRIWLDEETPNTEIGKSFNSKIVTNGQSIYTSTNNGVNLVSLIKTLYNGAEKTQVENGPDNSKIKYNYASSVSLMNDRLGTMSVGADDGNIRYYGASPNNYIDIGNVNENDVEVGNWEKFGGNFSFDTSNGCYEFFNYENLINLGIPCTDEQSCNEFVFEELGVSDLEEICGMSTIPAGTIKSIYRIIGLFKDVELSDGSKKDLVKVIRNESIGVYSWDSIANNRLSINEWSQADVMQLLNPNYEDEEVGGSLYWNSDSGNCYGYDGEYYVAIPCNFESIGLNDMVKNKIETVKWNLGGPNVNTGNGGTDQTIYSNQIYEYEKIGNVIQNPDDGITRTKKWTGNVALAYLSDYGYAQNLDSCVGTVASYSNCTENWMVKNGLSRFWLLNPHSTLAYNSWYVGVTSNDSYGSNEEVSNEMHILPVFYIDADLAVISGDGSEGNPYVVK